LRALTPPAAGQSALARADSIAIEARTPANPAPTSQVMALDGASSPVAHEGERQHQGGHQDRIRALLQRRSNGPYPARLSDGQHRIQRAHRLEPLPAVSSLTLQDIGCLPRPGRAGADPVVSDENARMNGNGHARRQFDVEQVELRWLCQSQPVVLGLPAATSVSGPLARVLCAASP